jgi:hypothetical protein
MRNTPVSWLDIHQARTMSTEVEMKAKMSIHQENMEAAIHSIQFELEETRQTSGRRLPVMYQLKDPGPSQGVRRLMKHTWTYSQ